MANRRDVPESVLFDILLFLPVISLLRFKTVCKSWCSIIESSDFVTQHLRHNSENKKGLLVLGSENELCFLSGSKYQVQSNSMHSFFLMEPCYQTSKKSTKISLLPPWGKIYHFSAFGFDKKTNDYKIVRITLQRGLYSVQHSLVQVYSMRTDSWRIIHKGNDFPIAFAKTNVDVASNGEMFLWIGTSLSLLTLLIFYFDLANEVYGTVPLPDHAARPKTPTTNLAFLNGKITYIECDGPREICSYYEIWMMDEFGKKESWNKVYKLEELILPCDTISEIHLLKNGEFILTKKHSGNDVGLYLFNLVTREERLLFDACKVRRIANYSESLVSIKSTKLT